MVVEGLKVSKYVEHLGFPPFDWQRDILDSDATRKLILGCRQAGKSTVFSGKLCHKAKYKSESLGILLAPTMTQSGEDVEKVKTFISHDTTFPAVVRFSDSQIKLISGSRILVVPATEASARGYSKPDMLLLDEASRIEDEVYQSGIRPMLTDNPGCELAAISTPHGKTGFFFRAWHRPDIWQRYLIRSPWDVDPQDSSHLIPAMPEEEYRAKMAESGVRAYYSPRHYDLREQEENLREMGPMQYKQEYCCEFVEPEENVFSYDDIERALKGMPDISPLGIPEIGECQGLEEART
jgi:hypothetical protein